MRDVTVNCKKSSNPDVYATPDPSGTTPSPQPYGPKFLCFACVRVDSLDCHPPSPTTSDRPVGRDAVPATRLIDRDVARVKLLSLPGSLSTLRAAPSFALLSRLLTLSPLSLSLFPCIRACSPEIPSYTAAILLYAPSLVLSSSACWRCFRPPALLCLPVSTAACVLWLPAGMAVPHGATERASCGSRSSSPPESPHISILPSPVCTRLHSLSLSRSSLNPPRLVRELASSWLTSSTNTSSLYGTIELDLVCTNTLCAGRSAARLSTPMTIGGPRARSLSRPTHAPLST